MSNQKQNDQMLLTDFLLGRCEPQAARAIRARLASEPDLQQMHDDLRNTLQALALLPEAQPPEDLADRTMAKIRSVRQTEALLTREEIRHGAAKATFSWRELSAMAAAVVLLAVILIPSIRQARRQRTIELCSANVGRIGTGLLNYSIDNNLALPSVEGSQLRWLDGDGEAVASNSVALFKLIRTGYVMSPVVFQCPATSGRSFAVQGWMVDFPSEDHIGYSYHHAIGENRLTTDDPNLSPVAEQMAILADRTPVFRHGRFLPEAVHTPASPNHDHAGQNVLYLDMHVGWKDTPAAGVEGNNIFLVDGVYEYRGDESPQAPTDTFLLPAHSGR